jgi:hypothetical protein
MAVRIGEVHYAVASDLVGILRGTGKNEDDRISQQKEECCSALPRGSNNRSSIPRFCRVKRSIKRRFSRKPSVALLIVTGATDKAAIVRCNNGETRADDPLTYFARRLFKRLAQMQQRNGY